MNSFGSGVPSMRYVDFVDYIDDVDEADAEDLRVALARVAAADGIRHRDLIGPAVAIVGRRRRRARTFGAASSGLLVAAGATAAIWVGGSPMAPRPEPAASATATTATTLSAPNSTNQTSGWDKTHDIVYRLPSLLNPLLPPGRSVAKSVSTEPNSAFQLHGPAGDNDFGLTATAKGNRNHAMEQGCVVGSVCSGRTVPGGTLYIQTKNFTADYGGQSGYAPGTGKQVLTVDAEYEFVPTADDGYVIDVTMTTNVSHEQYAAQAPKEWGDSPWPPVPPAGQAFNASGILLSPDEFLAVISKPGFTQVARLVDPTTPVDPTTLTRHTAAAEAVAAAAKPVLPAGFALVLDDGSVHLDQSYLTLTGPSGANEFAWSTHPQVASWQRGFICGGHTRADCTSIEVPGGEIEMSQTLGPAGAGVNTSLYAPGQGHVPYYRDDTYTYYPDDTKGTVVQLTMHEQFRDIVWSATRPSTGPYADSGKPWPPPTRTGQPFNADGPLLSPDQFAAMVRMPGLVNAVQAVDAALEPVNSDPKSFN